MPRSSRESKPRMVIQELLGSGRYSVFNACCSDFAAYVEELNADFDLPYIDFSSEIHPVLVTIRGVLSSSQVPLPIKHCMFCGKSFKTVEVLKAV